MKKNIRKTQNPNFATCRFHKTILFYIFFIFALEPVFAQVFELNNMPPPQMRVTFDKQALKENGFAAIEITIPESWHVNSHIPVDEFLKPSQLKIQSEGVVFDSLEWPTPKKDYNDILQLENLIFEGTFFIKAPVKQVETAYDSTIIRAVFHYQACSNSICLAPDSVVVSDITLFNHPFKASAKKETQQKSPQKKTQELQPIKEVAKIDSTPIKDKPKELTQANNLVPQNNDSPYEVSSPKENSIFLFLFFAFVGGLLLNLMPCVLPVLSLKLFSLIKQSEESKKRLTLLSLSTCFGILVSFWVLAFIVLIARLTGGTPGWGMQFQSPYFIAAMVALLTFFAMSFLGFFEIWLPSKTVTIMDGASKKEGLLGAFFTGTLLVLLSTPCSAPFLGSAMGFAFSAPDSILFLFFTAAALGLSTPYLLVGFFPSLLKFLPKPGKWMATLQKIMGFLLFASVCWLIWIGYSAFGKMGLLFFASLVIVNGVLSIGLGKFAPPFKPFVREVLAFVFIILINVIFSAVALERLKKNSHNLEAGWASYSAESLEQSRLEGYIVFLDVTADWCITCKANEIAVLESSELNAFFKENNVKKMKADWTHSSPEITELLHSLGRSGVPAYAVYPIDASREPIVLPELLTTNLIKSTIKSAQKSK